MERQSSFGSASSAGSAFSSAATKAVKEADKDGGGIDQQEHSLMTALFGALYTLAKEKINDTAGVAMLAIWVDFLMIFTLILEPEYPWAVNYKLWIYKVFHYIQIHLPIAEAGYQFYLVIFYILVSVLFVSTAICIWVGVCFMNDSFPFLWPIKVARIVVSLFVSMFYIASLNVFLMACACERQPSGRWTHLYFNLDCLSLPHIVHAAFSLTSSAVFFLVAALMVIADHELEPMSRSLLAAPHSMCELRSLLCKTLISCADLLFKPNPHAQVVMYAIACTLLFYYHARMVPHYVPWINVLRGGLNAVLAWCSILACAMAYSVEYKGVKDGHHSWGNKELRHIVTVVMAAGTPVVFALGGGLCWWRLVYAWRAALKFKSLPMNAKPRDARAIHRFASEFDVEVAARVGRVWDEEGGHDPVALDLAENVLKAGVLMQPTSVFLHIAYSNFLIEVRRNNQSGFGLLEKARRLGPNLSYQFSIFARGQEHKQRAAGGGEGGEGGSVDLVSYVAFQNNYKSLMVYHKASLVATRDFWRVLTNEVVPLQQLGRGFERMEEMEGMADKTYRLVLDRYPTNTKLLRSYGRFLESVKNNPWAAARYYAEAEKQEEIQETAAADMKMGALEGLVGRIDDKTAVLTINADGVIQIVNKATCSMLGYKKGELEGKPVTIMMPPPFSLRHSSYIRNYSNTGRTKVLNIRREVVALHKDRYVLPVQLCVTKISGSGSDALFMGAMNVIEPNPNLIQAWLLTTGTLLCAEQSFMDYAGWSAEELVGKAFSSLGADSSELDDLIASCSRFSEAELMAGAVQADTLIRHKYAESVPVRIKIEMGGTDDQRLLVVKMHRLAETAAMAAFDAKGRVIYANTPLASMLGYQLRALRDKDISQLLPPPYGTLHLRWIKEASALKANSAPGSCRNGVTSIMLSSNGTPVYVRAAISTHMDPAAAAMSLQQGGSGGAGAIWAMRVERSSPAQLLHEQRLQLLLTADGVVTWASSGSPASVFGFDVASLVGGSMEGIVDVFYEYLGGNGNMRMALSALMSRVAARPGSSWRVGVGDVAADKELVANAAAAAAAATQNRIMLRHQRARKSCLKPAVMIVAVPSEENVPEDVLAAAGSDAVVLLELWRADMLLGVAEVVEGCNLCRVEPSVGMVFGVSHTALFNTNLEQWLNLRSDTQLEDLLGSSLQRRGGMKGAATSSKVGPRKHVAGMHMDKRPVSVCLQACVKDSGADDRVVITIKLLEPLMGLPGLLAALVALDMAEGAAAGDVAAGRLLEMPMAPGGLAGSGGAAGGVAVPGLDMSQVGAGTGAGGDGDLLGSNTHRTTQRDTRRSAGGASALATARGVTLDVQDDDGDGEDGQHRAPAELAPSPTGSHEGGHGRARRHHGEHPGDAGGGAASDVVGGSEYDALGDGRRTPPRHGEDVAVSSDSDDGRARHAAVRAAHRKGKLTDEQMEAELSAKGARKAREWLESGFTGFRRDARGGDELTSLMLPGAVEEEGPAVHTHARNTPGGGAAGDGGGGGGDLPRAPIGDSSSDASGAVPADAAGSVSDFGRGKRLRKLQRLMNSKAALQVFASFRARLLLLAVAVVVLHLASFSVLLGFLAQQAGLLTDMAAAGSVADAAQRLATLSVVLDAAERGYGFNRSDMPAYAAEFDSWIARFEPLHQGLYFGFGRLRTLSNPALQQLWHEPHLVSTNFLDASRPNASSTSIVSLFTLGGNFLAAARELHYHYEHLPTRAPGEAARAWAYVHANGPGGELLTGYLHNLNLMTLRAQDSVQSLQYAMVGLLGIEGAITVVLAVGALAWLLKGISTHRQALFSVFLAIPPGYLRTLASKSVAIDDDDGGDDDDVDARAKQQVDDARKAKQLAASAVAAAEEGDAGSDAANTADGGKGAGTGGGKRQRKASFSVLHVHEGEAAVMVSAAPKAGGAAAGVKLGAPGAKPAPLPAFSAADRRKLFNGKRLETDAASVYKMAWPFVLWGVLVVVLYGVSYRAFGDIAHDLINIKLAQRLLIQGGAATYYITRVSLLADPVQRAALQPQLFDAAHLLEDIYQVALYGGSTLPDSLVDGSHDAGSGSLFTVNGLREVLFPIDACVRADASGCLPASSPFHAVSRSGVDAMLHRLSSEAELLGMDDAAAITPDNRQFQLVWSVAWHDMHDGLVQVSDRCRQHAASLYNAERTIHIILLVLMFVGGCMYLAMMMRPFLKHVSKESRRTAELLAQLPQDIDIEGMVAATWSVVKQERILAERSGKSFIDGLGSGGMGLLSRLSFVSASAPSWVQQPVAGKDAGEWRGPPALQGADGGGMARGARFAGGRPAAGEDGDEPERLFSPRGAGAVAREAPFGRGGPRAGPAATSAGGGIGRRRPGADAAGGGSSRPRRGDYEGGHAENLRRRAVPSTPGRRSNAVVPLDNDDGEY